MAQSKNHIVMHIPHDSLVIPDEHRADFMLSDEALEKEKLLMTDMHTADLYQYEGAARIVFPVSRLMLDPERFSDDSQEVMAERGMGVLYTVTSQLKEMRKPIVGTKRNAILNQYYYPHHESLSAAVKNSLSLYDKALVVDCHSFPAYPLPYEMAENNDIRAEICIGTDIFHTPDKVRTGLEMFFKDKGYSVAVDNPFAGALTPMEHYRTEKRVKAVMFEIRRDIYMDENTGKKHDRYNSVKTDISEAIGYLEDITG
ncbi:MAG: hypothetical protein CMH30_06340 [Micavibrio sp.]|nr:hypothetical protein [Micavibrio sp.]|tara:strand:- start:2683 stop:3453 length:771 start_codon:yes stop_codon:yes gene_type:complete